MYGKSASKTGQFAILRLAFDGTWVQAVGKFVVLRYSLESNGPDCE
ncbi:MAG: hypothetical protein ACJAR9_000551 [Celeribacter sp.]|jgi:hypothetical protein